MFGPALFNDIEAVTYRDRFDGIDTHQCAGKFGIELREHRFAQSDRRTAGDDGNFRPDGVPVTSVGTVGTCGAVGNTGDGGGAFYITNGQRDFAVVLSPLGGARVHVWSAAAGGWTS